MRKLQVMAGGRRLGPQHQRHCRRPRPGDVPETHGFQDSTRVDHWGRRGHLDNAMTDTDVHGSLIDESAFDGEGRAG